MIKTLDLLGLLLALGQAPQEVDWVARTQVGLEVGFEVHLDSYSGPGGGTSFDTTVRALDFVYDETPSGFLGMRIEWEVGSCATRPWPHRVRFFRVTTSGTVTEEAPLGRPGAFSPPYSDGLGLSFQELFDGTVAKLDVRVPGIVHSGFSDPLSVHQTVQQDHDHLVVHRTLAAEARALADKHGSLLLEFEDHARVSQRSRCTTNRRLRIKTENPLSRRFDITTIEIRQIHGPMSWAGSGLAKAQQECRTLKKAYLAAKDSPETALKHLDELRSLRYPQFDVAATAIWLEVQRSLKASAK